MADLLSQKQLEDLKVQNTPLTSGDVGTRQGNETLKEQVIRIAAVVKGWKDYINAIEKANKLDTSRLKLTGRQYQEIAKLEKQLVTMNKAQGAFGSVASALATKIGGSGGVTGSITRFTGGLSGLASKVNESTGTMRFMGIQTAITAGKFLSFVGAVQTGMGAIVQFMEVQDAAQKKQGQLIKAFGSVSGVSIAAPYQAASVGLKAAGEVGAEAAEKLQMALIQMRGVEGEEIYSRFDPGKSEGQANLRDLTAMQIGVDSKTIDRMVKLRNIFGMKDGDKMFRTLQMISGMAVKSGANIEMLNDIVMSLGESFAGVGVTVDDARSVMSQFADAIGRGGLSTIAAQATAHQTLQQFTTGAGVEKMFIAAHFASEKFTDLDPGLRDLLTTKSTQLFGKKDGPEVDFTGLDAIQQMSVFDSIGPKGFGQVREGLLLFMKDFEKAGELFIAKAISLELTGQEYLEIRDAYDKSRMAEKPAEEFDKLVNKLDAGKGTKEDVDLYNRTVKDFQNYYITVSDLQKEWFTGMMVLWNDIQAAISKSLFSSATDPATVRAVAQTQSDINKARQGTKSSIFRTHPSQDIDYFNRMNFEPIPILETTGGSRDYKTTNQAELDAWQVENTRLFPAPDLLPDSMIDKIFKNTKPIGSPEMPIDMTSTPILPGETISSDSSGEADIMVDTVGGVILIHISADSLSSLNNVKNISQAQNN